MRTCLFLLSVVTLSTLGSSVVFGQSSVRDTSCDWTSSTKPDALTGSVGTPTENYYFNHLADVDQADSKNRFVHIVKNLHRENYLPFEWVSQLGKTHLGFERLIPGGCARNEFETMVDFQEDATATINYGPQAQMNKTAPSFVKQGKKAVRVSVPLKSRLIADIQEGTSRPRRVSLEFSTALSENEFTYTVVNYGDQEELFSIPRLTQVWAKVKAAQSTEALSSWKEKDGSYSAPIKESQRHVIRASANINSREELAEVQVVSREGRASLIKGSITLYLPDID